MKALRLILPVAALAVTFLAANAFGTVTISKKEGGKPCSLCHEKGMASKANPLLNEVGKYYKDKRTLVGAPKK